MNQSLNGVTLLLLVLLVAPAWGQEEKKADEKPPKGPPSIDEFVKEMDKREGFYKTYWDDRSGKLYLEIDRLDEEFLYVHSLATGLGSNPVGLDRGKLGGERVVQFRKVGPRVFLHQKNLRFRARTDNRMEQRAVEQSFAESTLWGGKIVAETDGNLVVDLTPLLMSDVHGVVGKLSGADQGTYSLDADRSSIYLPRCKSFPKNIELEASLTFRGNKPGRHVRQTAPTAKYVTLRQHHSFIELPDDGYRPRPYDVRSPSMSITFADYAAPLNSPLEQRWIYRHRLQKKNPDESRSEAVEPIVYYVDPGAPAVIREALIEGASWWNQAFEAAGFIDAFQVKVLPDDADPMDVRYNVIQWVHRSTRGWSYGGSVIDPRTGEILKGHVTLGSLRVRQDRLLIESLAGAPPAPAGNGCACCGIGMTSEVAAVTQLAEEPIEVALARIRQLSAHEVGHTLGFVHNFAASTYGGRASVMDYPAPFIQLKANRLDFSSAYATGIGEWDKIAVRFAYEEFAPDTDEQVALDEILTGAAQNGMLFISDSDSRPSHAVHPLSNLWDNGSDPVDEFKRLLRIRRMALEQFSVSQLPENLVAADIEQYLVPIYLFHRYQLQAVGKVFGGATFAYGYAGDPVTRVKPVPLERQLMAWSAMIDSVTPDQLMLPARLKDLVGVKPYSQVRDQEQFEGAIGRVFDPYAPARVQIELTLNELLQPQRLARFAAQPKGDTPLTLSSIINDTSDRLWADTGDSSETRTLSQMMRFQMAERLMALAERPAVTVPVRRAAVAAIERLESIARQRPDNLPAEEAEFRKMVSRRIGQFQTRTAGEVQPARPATVPPGSPIGD